MANLREEREWVRVSPKTRREARFASKRTPAPGSAPLSLHNDSPSYPHTPSTPRPTAHALRYIHRPRPGLHGRRSESSLNPKGTGLVQTVEGVGPARVGEAMVRLVAHLIPEGRRVVTHIPEGRGSAAHRIGLTQDGKYTRTYMLTHKHTRTHALTRTHAHPHTARTPAQRQTDRHTHARTHTRLHRVNPASARAGW